VVWVESEDAEGNPATYEYVKAWKEANNVTFTVVSDPGFAQTYGVLSYSSPSLPHQYVISGHDMELVVASGGVGSRFEACTEDSQCAGDLTCATENICQGYSCVEHSDCPSSYCSGPPDGKACKGVTCGGDGDCGGGTCEVEGVCNEATCSSDSDCPSLQCKSGMCRGTTVTEEGWLNLL